MCSNLWSHVQKTNAFSCALHWRVVYSSQFYCLMSRYFGPLSIFTEKADAKDFAVLVYSRPLKTPVTYRLCGEQKAVYNNSEFKNLCDKCVYIDLY